MQADLRDTESSLPDHCNKMAKVAKWVPGVCWFPSAYKGMLLLYCSLLDVQQHYV